MKTLVLWLSMGLLLRLALSPAWASRTRLLGHRGTSCVVSRQRRRRTFPLTIWTGARRAERWDSTRRSARATTSGAPGIDLRNFPAEAAEGLGPRLARHLKIVLDQRLPIDGDSMSDSPAGHSRMACPDVEHVGRIETPGLPVNMRLQRVPRPDGVLIWKLSAASVAAIPDLYARYGYGRLGEHCRMCSSRRSFSIPSSGSGWPSCSSSGWATPLGGWPRPWGSGCCGDGSAS